MGALSGWLSLGQLVTWGSVFYTFALLAHPVELALGLTRAESSFAFSLALLGEGLMAFFVGRWIDAGYERRVMTIGAVVVGVGLLAHSQIDWWLAHAMPARHRSLQGLLGRHLSEPTGRAPLSGVLQRLLRQGFVRRMPVQQQRARAPRLPPGRAQRHQLVHGQHQLHVPLHHLHHRRGGLMHRRVLGLLASAWLVCAPLTQAAEGAALYAQHCAACHQADGSGTVGLAPPLKGEHWQRLGADRSYLAQVITHGLSGSIVVNGQRFVGSMPAFAGQLDDAQLAAIATYVQALQERPGPAYSAADLATARSATGSPTQSRSLRMQLLK